MTYVCFSGMRGGGGNERTNNSFLFEQENILRKSREHKSALG